MNSNIDDIEFQLLEINLSNLVDVLCWYHASLIVAQFDASSFALQAVKQLLRLDAEHPDSHRCLVWYIFQIRGLMKLMFSM